MEKEKISSDKLEYSIPTVEVTRLGEKDAVTTSGEPERDWSVEWDAI